LTAMCCAGNTAAGSVIADVISIHIGRLAATLALAALPAPAGVIPGMHHHIGERAAAVLQR